MYQGEFTKEYSSEESLLICLKMITGSRGLLILEDTRENLCFAALTFSMASFRPTESVMSSFTKITESR